MTETLRPVPLALPDRENLARRNRAALRTLASAICITFYVGTSVLAGTRGEYWTNWWLIAGFGVGLGLRASNRLRWPIALITGLSSGTAILWSGQPPLGSLVAGLIVSIGTAVAVKMLRQNNRRPELASADDLRRFFFAATVSGLTVGALSGLIPLVAGDLEVVAALFVRTAAEMAAGIILVASLEMRLPRAKAVAGLVELSAQWCVTLAVIVVTFWVNDRLPLAFIPFVPLVWGALRLQLRAFLTQLVAVATFVGFASSLGRGPFTASLLGADLSEVMVQVFDITLGVVLVALAIVVATRKTLTDALEKSQEAERENDRREIERAAEVQRALLPRDEFPVPGYLFAGVCIPTSAVGGDFYDWQIFAPGFAVTLGDVMGKGVGAGMLAAALRTAIRMDEGSTDASTAVERALQVIEPDLAQSASFATLFHARISTIDGTFTYSDAGHGLSFVLRSDGTLDRLRSDDVPLGLAVGEPRSSLGGSLSPGDLLVAFSDGVLDLWDGSLDAVAEVAEIARLSLSPRDLVEHIGDIARRSATPDDITIIAVKRALAS